MGLLLLGGLFWRRGLGNATERHCQIEPFKVWYPVIGKRLNARFYATTMGREPVRDWLLGISREDRKTVGYDIGRIEDGWPLGMPLARSLADGLWEVRSSLSGGRIARVMFVVQDGSMILLHGFEKKSQKTPRAQLETARARLADFRRKQSR